MGAVYDVLVPLLLLWKATCTKHALLVYREGESNALGEATRNRHLSAPLNLAVLKLLLARDSSGRFLCDDLIPGEENTTRSHVPLTSVAASPPTPTTFIVTRHPGLV